MKKAFFKNLNKFLKIIAIMMILLGFVGCSNSDEKETAHVSTGILEYNSIAELDGRRIGILTGSVYDDISMQLAPNGEFAYFNTVSDLVSAIHANKADAFAIDENIAREVIRENPDLGYIKQPVMTVDSGLLFPKTEQGNILRQQFDEFLTKAKESGLKQELEDKWDNYDDNTAMSGYEALEDINGTLNLAVYAENPPYAFIMNGMIVGYDIELAMNFCKENGYGLNIINITLDGLLSAVQSGKADFGGGGLNITEERKKTVDFSIPTSTFSGYFIVRSTATSDLAYEHINELNGKRIGISTGTVYDAPTNERFPDSKFEYYSNSADLLEALRSGKIDAYASDYNLVREIVTDNPDIGYIPEVFIKQLPAFAFSKKEKGEKLMKQMNEFLSTIEESGLRQKLYNRWFEYYEDAEMADYSTLEGNNGVLKVGCSGMDHPFSFIRNEKVTGYEAELAYLFCEKYGYKLEFEIMSFNGTISALESGKIDMACGAIAITEERKENVNFSVPICENNGYFLVNKTTRKTKSLFENLKESFYSTFIVENRWKMFMSGALVTMAITVLSIICGTILGFAAYLKARNGNDDSLFNRFVNFMIWLIQGLPMVVLLMILYYIIFGSISISGFVVAVIGFTLTFACSMYSMLKAGEKAVDKGQREAAFTLGYTPMESFYKIILPQAAYHFMPSYKGEIVSLIQATAVVGYIAVQDITKIGDIVRSRTYEAFFPLIMIAIMYFVMAAILTSIVNRIDIFIDPARKNKYKILKGVDTDD
ncbi:MAG: transporter substrate-binding domain-containing protein [Erysipelotrichaceae bacterium]|nr:transporter substrate-binding domain-containing protein [Erysipelotrichaceae bacterium]